MNFVLFLTIQFIVTAALVGGTALLGLVFRNPFRPEWLKRGWTDSAAAVAIAAGFSGVIGYGMLGSAELGMGVAAGIILTLAIFAGTVVAVFRLFHFGERLRRAERGQSPFAPLHAHGAEPLGTTKHPAT
jgi:hypothetical protein